MLAKLQAYCIRGDYINWFRSYLTCRTQYVHTRSPWFTLTPLSNVKLNPIRSRDNDRPSYDLKNYCINLHLVIHEHFARYFRHIPIRIFQKVNVNLDIFLIYLFISSVHRLNKIVCNKK